MDVTFVERNDLSRVDQRHAGTKRQALKNGKNRVPTKLTSKQRLVSKVYNLSLDVAALRQQLQQLELHKSLLETRSKYKQREAEETACKTTTEYWKVFQRGFRATDQRQSAFLQSAMDDGLQLGGEALLRQWELYAEYFAIPWYEMHSVRVVSTDEATGCCITRSEGEFCGSFTMRGLEMVFPAVLRDPQLTRRLLGREMKTPIAFVSYYDAQGTWVRHDTDTDFLKALGDALGGDIIQAACSIMQKPSLLEEIMIKRVGEESERRVEFKPHTTTTTTEPWYMVYNQQWAKDEEETTRLFTHRECNQEEEYEAMRGRRLMDL